MARTKTKNGADAAPMTTAQMLGSLLKSARDIMRKDKGLNGDLDRLPLLTWIMFLKFLDDLEQQREEEAKLAGQEVQARHRAALSLARLGRRSAGHHRRRTARLHQQRRSRARRTAREARACSLTCARSHQLQRRQPPRCDRHRVQGRR